tara:strand:+ start:306 stop:446 length:141 start_codon:yes stop_codon:yes gene_type:complete
MPQLQNRAFGMLAMVQFQNYPNPALIHNASNSLGGYAGTEFNLLNL